MDTEFEMFSVVEGKVSLKNTFDSPSCEGKSLLTLILNVKSPVPLLPIVRFSHFTSLWNAVALKDCGSTHISGG